MVRKPSAAWRAHYLRLLDEAGATGVPAWHWKSAEVVLPTMIEHGLVEVVERTEVVRYYVLTEAGRKARA